MNTQEITGQSPAPTAELVLNAALMYANLGRSVIPVYVDANRAKTPAVHWSIFQRRRATTDDLTRWFSLTRFSGIGIVTGLISLLCVLDFDNDEAFAAFATAFPDLTETYIVRTRRGWHVYFALPPYLHVSSRSVTGIDLLAEGKYVVAPPTTIDGFRYKSVRGGQPRILSENDLSRVHHFLDGRSKPRSTVNDQTRGLSPLPATSTPDLADLYKQLTLQNGRNHALFYSSLRARDMGWTPQQAENMLLGLHMGHPPTANHRTESAAQRQREGERTIASAYTRPPRRETVTPSTDEAVSCLPNTIREALLKRKDGAAVLRTLEGLTLAGHSAPTITAPDARRLLAGGVGKDSIRAALNAVGVDGQPIFEPCTDNSPPAPPVETGTGSPSGNGLNGSAHDEKNASSGGQNPPKMRGRSARVFYIPGVYTLCQRLGIDKLSDTQGDPIRRADLKSPKTLRAALEYRFIQRRPGQYFQALLAERLNVSDRTVRRYHADVHAAVCAEPCFIDTLITWANVDKLPTDADIREMSINVNGMCLQDPHGKRYPVKREIAVRLLVRHKRLTLRRQTASFYWVGDVKPASRTLKPPISTAKLVVEPPAYQKHEPCRGMVCHALMEHAAIQPLLFAADTTPKPLIHVTPRPDAPPLVLRSQPIIPPARPPRKTRRYYRQALPDVALENIAQRVYTATTRPTDPTNTGHELSLPNARRLVETFGFEAVQHALKELDYQRSKGKVRNPAGFLITVCGTRWRILNPDVLKRPQFTAEPRRTSRAARKPYDFEKEMSKASLPYLHWRLELAELEEGRDRIEYWRGKLHEKRMKTGERYLKWRLKLARENANREEIAFWKRELAIKQGKEDDLGL